MLCFSTLQRHLLAFKLKIKTSGGERTKTNAHRPPLVCSADWRHFAADCETRARHVYERSNPPRWVWFQHELHVVDAFGAPKSRGVRFETHSKRSKLPKHDSHQLVACKVSFLHAHKRMVLNKTFQVTLKPRFYTNIGCSRRFRNKSPRLGPHARAPNNKKGT